MNEISTPEIHSSCFSPIIRKGHVVWCTKCGQIGETIGEYITTWKPEKITNRKHRRAFSGKHRFAHSINN